jgi:xanthine dehydrogenase YagR molybdenum-binding subunit
MGPTQDGYATTSTVGSAVHKENQVTGGALGGKGMALMKDLFIDHRFGRPINNNLADYHKPVHADISHVVISFVNKKVPCTNPMGSKRLGEIALIGMALANAVFNATGKRIRSLL